MGQPQRRPPGSYPYHTLNLTVPTTLRRRIVCWRACWAPRPLWGKNPAVPVRFLLHFFFHTPPPKLAHLSLHLGFDFPERAARLLVLFVHGPRVSALFVNRTRNRFTPLVWWYCQDAPERSKVSAKKREQRCPRGLRR